MYLFLTIKGGSLMMSDSIPEHGHPKHDTLHLQVEDIDVVPPLRLA